MSKELNLESVIGTFYNDMVMWNYMNPTEPDSLDDQYNLGYMAALEDILDIIKMHKEESQGL